jgi:hypothetical protein
MAGASTCSAQSRWQRDIPVSVDTGLVFVEANVCASRLASDEMEAHDSWLWEMRLAADTGRRGGDWTALADWRALSPSKRPRRMYRSFCEDFFPWNTGFMVPPSSSERMI